MIFRFIITIACKNFANSMMGLVNSNRSDAGLELLRSIQNLESAARDQALYMCENSLLTHTNPAGDLIDRARRNGFKGLSIGENIAKSHNDEYKDVVKMWMSSQRHKKNIMGNFNYTGVATCLDKNGNRFWVQVFGKDGPEDDEDESAVSLDDKEEKAPRDMKKIPEPYKDIVQSSKAVNPKKKPKNDISNDDEDTEKPSVKTVLKTVTASASTPSCSSTSRKSKRSVSKSTITVTETVLETHEIVKTESVDKLITTTESVNKTVTMTTTETPKNVKSPGITTTVKLIQITPENSDAILIMKAKGDETPASEEVQPSRKRPERKYNKKKNNTPTAQTSKQEPAKEESEPEIQTSSMEGTPPDAKKSPKMNGNPKNRNKNNNSDDEDQPRNKNGNLNDIVAKIKKLLDGSGTQANNISNGKRGALNGPNCGTEDNPCIKAFIIGSANYYQ